MNLSTVQRILKARAWMKQFPARLVFVVRWLKLAWRASAPDNAVVVVGAWDGPRDGNRAVSFLLGFPTDKHTQRRVHVAFFKEVDHLRGRG